MDYTSANPQQLSAAELQSLEADNINDFSATSPQSVKAEAVEASHNFRSYAGERASAFKEGAGIRIKQGAVRAKEFHATAEDYIRENPTKSVLGAVGIGVVIGLILRR